MLKRCKKKRYEIEYKIVEPGIEVYNFLENAYYVTDPEQKVIITGTLGEQWVVTEDKLNETYDRDKDGLHGKATTKVDKDAPIYYFEMAEEPCIIKTSYGVNLKAAIGDVVLCSSVDGKPNLDDKWVVNNTIRRNGKTIWESTYEEII